MGLLSINYGTFLIMITLVDYINWGTAYIEKCDYILTCYTTKITVICLFC